MYDLLIYGMTPAGIIAAHTAAEHGCSVAILEPSSHIGGMVTGGLGWTDYGKEATVGGRSRRFYELVGQEYGLEMGWHFEPHVALRVFQRLLEAAGPGSISIALSTELDRTRPPTMHGTQLQVVYSMDGDEWQARQFIDCSYEGDLMAPAGVTTRIGREGCHEFSESLAGILDPRDESIRQPKTDFPETVDPYVVPGQPDSGLLPGIHGVGLPTAGSADELTQAYNFRICLTQKSENRIALTEPDDYDPNRFELLARLIASQRDLPLHCRGWGKRGLLKISPMPGEKTDINDGCAFSTDHIGACFAWPDGTASERQRIFDDHLAYTQGLLCFIASDPRVPGEVRDEFSQYGYPRDEYADTQHFSPQLYVREARRMVGAYVMRQQDCWGDIHSPIQSAVGAMA
jgi:hypothetical protein